MTITILVDDEKSWFTPYARKLEKQLLEQGHNARLIHNQKDAEGGDISFLLSCTKLVKTDLLP